MIFAYARVSTSDQSTESQINELNKYGYNELITDVISGKDFNRSGLDELKLKIRAGDILLVWRLDRLGRSLMDVLKLVTEMKNKGVHVISITDGVNSQTPIGNLMLGLMATLSEYEYHLLRQRQKVGIEARKRKGLLCGRKKGLSQVSLEKAALAKDLYSLELYSITEIMKKTKIGSRATFYKYINLKQE